MRYYCLEMLICGKKVNACYMGYKTDINYKNKKE